MAFAGITIVQTWNASLLYLYYTRVRQRSHFAGHACLHCQKIFFSTFRGGEVEPVTAPLKYGPVYEPVRLSVPSFARRTPLRRVCC